MKRWFASIAFAALLVAIGCSGTRPAKEAQPAPQSKESVARRALRSMEKDKKTEDVRKNQDQKSKDHLDMEEDKAAVERGEEPSPPPAPDAGPAESKGAPVTLQMRPFKCSNRAELRNMALRYRHGGGKGWIVKKPAFNLPGLDQETTYFLVYWAKGQEFERFHSFAGGWLGDYQVEQFENQQLAKDWISANEVK